MLHTCAKAVIAVRVMHTLKPDLPNQIKDFPSLKKEWLMSDQNIYTPLNIKKHNKTPIRNEKTTSYN